jgi:hypothetical protein
MTRGAQETLCPLVWLPAPRVHQPCRDIACSLGPMHHPGRRTGRLDRPGALLPCQPAVTLLLRNRCALTRLGHGRFRPLPDLQPHHPSIAALGRNSHRGRAPRRCTRLDLYGAHPGLRLGPAVMQNRRVWHQPHDLLRAEARPGGVGMARPQLLDTTVRVMQQTLGGHRLGPAMARGRNPADRSRAQPAS